LTALLAFTSYVACKNESVPSEPAGDAFPAEELTVTRVEPSTLPRGSTFDLQVFGTGFDERSIVSLRMNGSTTPKVRTNATRFVSPRQLSASITAAADAPGGPYDVVVEGRNGKQGVGTELVDGTLRIFGVSPTTAEPGQDVLISGSSFGTDRMAVKVTFDESEAVIRSVSNNQITAQVPWYLEPGEREIRIKVHGAPNDLTTHLNVQLGDPVISFLQPITPLAGDSLMIVGRNFGSQSDRVTVLFDSFSAPILSLTNTWIKVIVPEAIAAHNVMVTIIVGSRATGSTVVVPVTVPNVAGWYDVNGELVRVTQDGIRVSFSGYIFTGILSQDGRLQGRGRIEGCEDFSWDITFSASGFVLIHECINLGVVVYRERDIGFRVPPPHH
jgi:hypothetical protein